jgi:hypothetical protein
MTPPTDTPPPIRIHRSGIVIRTDTQAAIGTVSPTSAQFGDWPRFRQYKATTTGGASLGMFPTPAAAAVALWHAAKEERVA